MPTRPPLRLAAPLLLWLLALLAVGWLCWTAFDAPAATVPDDAPRPQSGAPAGSAAERASAAATTSGEVPAPTDRAAVPPAPAQPVALRRGRVLDSRGLPLADVPVGLGPYGTGRRAVLWADPPPVRSDARGEFALPAAAQVAAPFAGPGWFTLRSTPCRPGLDDELVVIAARAVRLEGRVTTPDGLPLAAVAVQATTMFLAEFPRPLEHAFAPPTDVATTGPDGAYALADVPIAAGVDLSFARPGYQGKRVPTEQAATGRLDLVLVSEAGTPGRLHGRVLAAQRPLAGAKLRLGADQQATSDERGEFAFELPKQPALLFATARDWQPVVRERIGADRTDLVVEFTQRALRIAGRVQFAGGAPAAGFRIDLLDPQRGPGIRALEAECSDGPAVPDALARTDAGGRFELGGLADRTYRLLAYDAGSLLAVRSEPIAAGTTGALLEIPADAVLAELRGTVVDRRGLPVAGAGLLAYLAPANASSIVPGPQAATDAQGRFVLKNVPRCAVQLGVSGKDLEYVTRPIEDWLAAADLRVVVARTCHVQIEGEAGLRVTFLDGDGKQLGVTTRADNQMFGGNGWTLRGGKSPVVTVPETAVTMAWSRDGRELGRKAVSLVPATGQVALLIAAP